jgi:uncharacterized protein with GYD domain
MTQQGVQKAKDIPQRREAARQDAESLGITLREAFLTMGSYDVVLLLDAPDGETLAKFVLKIGMRGNLTTETLRAFTSEEADRVISAL